MSGIMINYIIVFGLGILIGFISLSMIIIYIEDKPNK